MAQEMQPYRYDLIEDISMKKREGFLAQLGQAFNGLAYAQLGEHLSTEQKRTALAGLPDRPLPPPSPTAQPRRRVGLAIHHDLSPHALRYARSACARLGADLAVLTPNPTAIGNVVEQARRGLAAEGIQVELIPMGRDLVRGIHEFVRLSAGLLFVVVGAEEAEADQLMNSRSTHPHPEVPWVVVANPSTP